MIFIKNMCTCLTVFARFAMIDEEMESMRLLLPLSLMASMSSMK